MSLFSVIGSVSLGESGESGPGSSFAGAEADGVFADDPDGEMRDPRDEPGVDLVLLPPPLPSGARGRATVGGAGGGGVTDVNSDGLTLRERKIRLRDANADMAAELVRATGWSHPQVNAELNRLSGVKRISEATLDQLETRLKAARKWLRSA